MASFEAKTCWALTTPILDIFLQIMHFILDCDTMYNRVNRDTDKTSLSCLLLLLMPRRLRDGTCHGWRRWCVLYVAYHIPILVERQILDVGAASLGFIFS